MTRIPSLTPREILTALKRAGYSESRQSGTHLTLKHPSRLMVIVPVHAKNLILGTMFRSIRQ